VKKKYKILTNKQIWKLINKAYIKINDALYKTINHNLELIFYNNTISTNPKRITKYDLRIYKTFKNLDLKEECLWIYLNKYYKIENNTKTLCLNKFRIENDIDTIKILRNFKYIDIKTKSMRTKIARGPNGKEFLDKYFLGIANVLLKRIKNEGSSKTRWRMKNQYKLYNNEHTIDAYNTFLVLYNKCDDNNPKVLAIKNELSNFDVHTFFTKIEKHIFI
jgi:hypothetical protein